MAQYPQPRTRAGWGSSDTPMTAVTDLDGVIKKLSLRWMPRRFSASSAASTAGWSDSGRSP